MLKYITPPYSNGWSIRYARYIRYATDLTDPIDFTDP